ncbi:unnamed protein product [Cyclocybe aegerita]|uniref:Uncharacterized protein n=1 Tax=Cyclocybe aegerita TaxID=1973307 RepID=A0A8S0WIY7_CYCAE|nr:unnamed protein product [Cyclocybe aegerita]
MLKVTSIGRTYNGMSLTTPAVASLSNLDIVCNFICNSLLTGTPFEAILPSSTSFIKIIDIPYFDLTNGEKITQEALEKALLYLVYCNIWAVDPSVHSGQAFSLSVCRALQEWFEADDLHCITFLYVPSALHWDIHGKVHKYVTELKVRVGRRKMDNSIDVLHSQAAHSVLDSWSSTFQDPTYRGSDFLELQWPDGWPIQPSYLNRGPWLSYFRHSITEFAHIYWCITGHAPIGEVFALPQVSL